jgi:hypothetical protein
MRIMATPKMPGQPQVEKETLETLEHEFNQLAEQWRNETGMASFVRQKAMHPAYQKMIGMGKDALPFIFRELKERGGDWLWALEAIARPQINPALGTTNFKDAVSAWVKWGEKKRL